MKDDTRPKNCRFRLRDEGAPYPRSGCTSCNASVATGFPPTCAEPPATTETFAAARRSAAELMARQRGRDLAELDAEKRREGERKKRRERLKDFAVAAVLVTVWLAAIVLGGRG